MPTCSFHLMQRQSQAVISLMLAITLTVTTQAQDVTSSPQTVRVKRGQVLEFSLLTSLDSGHAQQGDDVALTLTHPLVADGQTVLFAGWTAHTRIEKVVRAGNNCKSGKIAWKLSRLDPPGNKKLRLQPIPALWAKPNGQLLDRITLDSKSGETPDPINKWPLLIIFAPLLVFAAVGALMPGDCDGRPGSEAAVPAGTDFYFVIAKDADVTSH